MQHQHQPTPFNSLYGRTVPILIGIAGLFMCRSTIGTTLSLLIVGFGFAWFWGEVQRMLAGRGPVFPHLRLLSSPAASLGAKLHTR